LLELRLGLDFDLDFDGCDCERERECDDDLPLKQASNATRALVIQMVAVGRVDLVYVDGSLRLEKERLSRDESLDVEFVTARFMDRYFLLYTT